MRGYGRADRADVAGNSSTSAKDLPPDSFYRERWKIVKEREPSTVCVIRALRPARTCVSSSVYRASDVV